MMMMLLLLMTTMMSLLMMIMVLMKQMIVCFLSNGVKIKMALGARNNLVQPNPCLLANERKWKFFFEWDFSVSIIGLKILEGLLVPCGQESCSRNQLRIEQRTNFFTIHYFLLNIVVLFTSSAAIPGSSSPPSSSIFCKTKFCKEISSYKPKSYP